VQFETVKVQLVELDEMKAFVSKGKDVKLKSDTDDKDVKFQEAHLFAKQPTAAQVETRITQFRKKLRDMELTIKLKDDNKTVALGTSKINYMEYVCDKGRGC
jgi:DNA topoisomerase I